MYPSRLKSVRIVIAVIAMIRRRLSTAATDAGMTTAEYAVGTVVAVAFAAVLFKVVQSPAVHAALSGIITHALNAKL